MKKFKRLVKGLKNIDLEAYIEGKKNFENPKEEIEKQAQQRIEVCYACEMFSDEVVESLKVKDTYLPSASGKFCGECGCISSFLIRQNTKVCKEWER